MSELHQLRHRALPSKSRRRVLDVAHGSRQSMWQAVNLLTDRHGEKHAAVALQLDCGRPQTKNFLPARQ